MPSNWYKGTFCFYATHAKRRGKRKEKKKTPQTVKKAKKWDSLQWSLSNPASRSTPCFVGELVTGLGLTQSTWWAAVVSIKRIEFGGWK